MKELFDLLRQIKESLDDLRNSFKESISTKEIKEEHIQGNENVYLDVRKSSLVVRGKEIIMTYNEYVILNTLFCSKNGFSTYKELIEALYGICVDESSLKSLTVCVARIRKKTKGLLEIQTFKNKGYVWSEVIPNE